MIVLKKINRRKNVTTEKLETSRCPCSIRLRKWLPIRLVKCFPIVGLVGQGGSSDEARHSVKNRVHQPTPAAAWRKKKWVFWKKRGASFESDRLHLKRKSQRRQTLQMLTRPPGGKPMRRRATIFHMLTFVTNEKKSIFHKKKKENEAVFSPGVRLRAQGKDFPPHLWHSAPHSEHFSFLKSSKQIWNLNISSLYYIKGLSYTVLVERLFVDFLCFTCPSPPLWLLK